jgi:hypothetical protein
VTKLAVSRWTAAEATRNGVLSFRSLGGAEISDAPQSVGLPPGQRKRSVWSYSAATQLSPRSTRSFSHKKVAWRSRLRRVMPVPKENSSSAVTVAIATTDSQPLLPGFDVPRPNRFSPRHALPPAPVGHRPSPHLGGRARGGGGESRPPGFESLLAPRLTPGVVCVPFPPSSPNVCRTVLPRHVGPPQVPACGLFFAQKPNP